MKIITILARIVFALILLMPVVGALNVFPAPTADLYTNEQAYNFIIAMMNVGYITAIMGVVCAIAVGLIITNRMALASLLVLPITVNIVAFHAVIDGGLFTAGAVMGNVLLLLNIFFLWQNRARYTSLLAKSN